MVYHLTGEFISIMKIKLWGVRGSLASPLSTTEYHHKLTRVLQRAVKQNITELAMIENFIRALPPNLRYVFGGNTTCVSVESDTGSLNIIDFGTGIKPLGDELVNGPCGKGQGSVNLFLTHNHWDHIQGLPFFRPLYIKGNVLNFYSTCKGQENILVKQMEPPYFPARFEDTLSVKTFTELKGGPGTVIRLEEDLTLEWHNLKHPSGSTAYKFRQGGKTFIFATDCELTGEILENSGSDTDFFMNADLLVLDSQYTLDESFQKIDWGHTSYTMAVNCAIRWKVKNLVLTHHEPSYTDDVLYSNYIRACMHRKAAGSRLPVIYTAREGMTFRL